jgi:hypothetical protein
MNVKFLSFYQKLKFLIKWNISLNSFIIILFQKVKIKSREYEQRVYQRKW